MEPFDSIVVWMSEFLGGHLYEGVFLAALIETIIPPIPTLAVFPTAGFLASQEGFSIWAVIPMILLGALGATIGTTGIYLIALKLGRTILLRYLRFVKVNESKLERVEIWFEKYGDKAVFLGRMVPVMREMISVPAGLLKMKIPKFVLYTFAGSLIWSTGTILAGYYFGNSLDWII
ncbi:MAG: DedA family protein [Nitrososphaeria archaeon]|nr:DedA family protein [Nitrosopumilaceae archaeon]NIP09271.1 DedA family protein [Nitrosopumilaceae archaeon]NIP91145.1 DedA family protein [Nitrososphaeria archaeon]NIS94439.1 DedA family protein [Nitrosopumilaceae archaeon]